jgi:hypothetical protein
MKAIRLYILSAVFIACAIAALGQSVNEQGIKPYGSFHGGDLDEVNVSNGHVELHISLLDYPQRGNRLKLSFIARYHNAVWNEIKDCAQGITFCINSWFPDQQPGVSVITNQAPPGPIQQQLISGGNTQNPVYAYSLRLYDESVHPLGNTSGTVYETLDTTAIRYDLATQSMTLSDGSRYPNIGSGPTILEDTNGNQITFNAPSGTNPNGIIVDTMGRSIPWPGGSGGTQDFSGCTGLLATSLASLWTVPGSNGSLNTFKFCYAQVFIYTGHWAGKTDTSAQHYVETNGFFPMLQSIVRPDQTTWTFDYSQPVNGINWGDLVKITTPTGGTISYVWNHFDGCHGGIGTPGSRTAAVTQRAVDAQDGSGPQTWRYSGGILAGQVKVTDPFLNDTVHTFTDLNSSCSFYETKTELYTGSQSSGTLLKTTSTDYTFALNPNIPQTAAGGPSPVINVVPIRKTTSWPGQASKIEYSYDLGFSFNNSTATGLYGKQTAVNEFDIGTGPPALLKSTSTSYLWQSPSGNQYLAYNILDAPSTVAISNSASMVSQTTFNYDESTPIGSTISISHDLFPANGNIRGNQTSIQHWLNGTVVSTPSCPVAVAFLFSSRHISIQA